MTSAEFKPVALPSRPSTTGIGSLPHHNIDAALASAFQVSIPFLPQIPIRNPWEYMIAQALDGLPGIQVEKDGSVTLDPTVWSARSHALGERLMAAFGPEAGPGMLDSFEPSAATSSSWQPFLWELGETGAKIAKIQLAGPLTCQWVVRLKDGSDIARHPELTTQIFRLVLARALAMCRRLKQAGIQPVIYLDEPGLTAFSTENPRHQLALRELKILIQTIRKENALVGLHCCGETAWQTVLDLDLNLLSLDTGLSLRSLLGHKEGVERFVHAGGRLSLGVVPTTRTDGSDTRALDVAQLCGRLLGTFEEAWKDKPELVRRILAEAVYTPACGLALHTTADADLIMNTLVEFEKFVSKSVLGL